MVSNNTIPLNQCIYQISNHPLIYNTHDVVLFFFIKKTSINPFGVYFYYSVLVFNYLPIDNFVCFFCFWVYGIREVSMEKKVLWEKKKKKTSGLHGCSHFSRHVSLFNAKSTQIPTRVNAICIAWTVWMEPFALHVSLPTKNTD